MRIVEIGDKPFVKSAFPAEVDFYSTRAEDRPYDDESRGGRLTLRTLQRLARLIHDPSVSLIVCHPTFFPPWHWNLASRAIFNRRAASRALPFVPSLGPQLLRWQSAAPVAIFDTEDMPLINRSNHFLLDRCTLYFKRELPVDRWRLMMKAAHHDLPTPRFRRLRRHPQTGQDQADIPRIAAR